MAERRVRTANVHARVEPSLLEAFKRAATADHRTLTQMLEVAMREAIEKRGGPA